MLPQFSNEKYLYLDLFYDSLSDFSPFFCHSCECYIPFLYFSFTSFFRAAVSSQQNGGKSTEISHMLLAPYTCTDSHIINMCEGQNFKPQFFTMWKTRPRKLSTPPWTLRALGWLFASPGTHSLGAGDLRELPGVPLRGEVSEEGNPAGLSSCSGGLRPLVELCVEPAGLCGRCTCQVSHTLAACSSRGSKTSFSLQDT